MLLTCICTDIPDHPSASAQREIFMSLGIGLKLIIFVAFVISSVEDDISLRYTGSLFNTGRITALTAAKKSINPHTLSTDAVLSHMHRVMSFEEAVLEVLQTFEYVYGFNSIADSTAESMCIR